VDVVDDRHPPDRINQYHDNGHISVPGNPKRLINHGPREGKFRDLLFGEDCRRE